METKIREAVLANHGGLNGASDAQIFAIWQALAPDTQARYLKPEPVTKTKGKENAVSTGPKGNI